MFIGRQREKQELYDFFSSDKKKAAIMYGKRRVGKTSLLLEAAKDYDGIVIFYECGKVSMEKNIESFSRSVSSALGISLSHESFESVFSIFKLIDKKVLVIIDEFQYLKRKSDDYEAESSFKRIIDTLSPNTKIILNGSSIGVMKDILTYSNPLYGRFDTIINLTEFDYYESSLFFPSLSVNDKIAFWAVFGGSPYVLSLLDYSKSLEENISSLILNRNGSVRTYIEYIIASELSGVNYLEEILLSLSSSRLRYNEIEDRIGISRTGILSRYLEMLLNMELISRRTPINRKDDKKKRFYEISDNLLKFYFSYVYSMRGLINTIGEETFYRNYIEKSISTFISYRFEEAVREYFSRKSRKGGIDLVDIGTYWYDDKVKKTNGEFDCVIRNSLNEYSCYEVKLYSSPMTRKNVEEEIEKMKKVEGIDISSYGVVSSSGFDSDRIEGVNYITGDELFEP